MKSIFVSSTFRDMQSERDMLRLDVLSVLNERAREYGESIDFIDLRWGVNTGDLDNDEGSQRVLSVCLDEIDRAKPYMLIFLGDRYGWMPEERILQTAAQQKNFQRTNSTESVTALEIEYGVLSREQLDHCIVCIREPLPYDQMDPESRLDYQSESPAHKRKLDLLKAKLCERLGEHVIFYRASWDAENRKLSGLGNLAETLISRFFEMFTEEWQRKATLCPHERELVQARNFFYEKERYFAGRQALLSEYLEAVLSPKGGLFLLKGVAGSGKSSMLAMLINNLEQHNYIVLPFACGNSTGSMSAEGFIRQAVWFLETKLNITEHFGDKRQAVPVSQYTPPTNHDWQIRLAELTSQYQSTELPSIAFVIDALDQLTETDALRTFSFLPDNVGGKIRFVISCLNSFPLPALPGYEKQLSSYTLPLLSTKAEMQEVLHGILEAQHKGLDNTVWEVLLKKNLANPLYASLLLQRLIIMDSDDLASANDGKQLNKRMVEIIERCSDELPILSAELFQEAGERINPQLTQLVLELLATSRRGLRESDLEAIFAVRNLPWNRLDFTRLTRFLAPYFMCREDGRFDFTHRTFREGILLSISSRFQYDQMILKRIKALPIDDSLRSTEGIFHAGCIGDTKFLLEQTHEAMSSAQVLLPITRSIIEFSKADNASFLLSALADHKNMKAYINAELFFASQTFKNELEDDLELAEKIYCALLCYSQEQLSNQHDGDVLERISLYNDRLAMICSLHKEYQEALKYLHESGKHLQLALKQLDTKDLRYNLAICFYHLAGTYSTLADYKTAKYYYLQAFNLQETEDNDKPSVQQCSLLAMLHDGLGCIAQEQENLHDAYTHFSWAANLHLQVYQCQEAYESLRLLAHSTIKLGHIDKQRGNYAQAIILFEEASQMFQTIYRTDGRVTTLYELICITNILARMHDMLDDHVIALEIYQKSMFFSRTLLELSQHPMHLYTVANCHWQYASLSALFNDSEDIADAYRIACILYEQLLELPQYRSSILPSLSYALRNLAEWYFKVKDFSSAKDTLLRELAIELELYQLLPDENRMQDLQDCLQNITLIYHRLGDMEAIEKWLAKKTSILKHILPTSEIN